MSFVSTPSFLLAEGVQVALPGGTGTAARSAALVAQGRLSLGERFVHESITGGLRAIVTRRAPVTTWTTSSA